MLGPGPSRDYGGCVQDRSVRSLLGSFDAVSAIATLCEVLISRRRSLPASGRHCESIISR
ncbi:hypothetical protein CBM2610_U10025 [Cupriavidus taiwanensis]|nr:hypothetical protein CBM2610_U10025 [Cupriavidus taiwanensis]